MASLSVILVGCQAEAAAPVDAGNAVHCAVLADAFATLGAHTGASHAQVRAAKAIQQWYSAQAKEKGFVPGAAYAAEAAPVLEVFARDPLSLKDEMATCTNRAADHPQFDTFADQVLGRSDE